jgi:hypothetical protein
MYRKLCIGVACCFSWLWGLTVAPAGEQDFGELAKGLVPKIVSAVKEKIAATGLHRLAVFAPGDANGKVTREMASPCQTLQGELIFHLRAQLTADGGTRVLVLDKGGLQRAFLQATEAVDPSAITSDDPQGTAKALKSLQIDAAVVGSIDATSAEQVKGSGEREIRVNVAVVFQDGTFKTVDGRVDSDPKKPPEGLVQNEYDAFEPPVAPIESKTCGRFAVEIFSAIDGFQKPLALVTSKDPNSEFHNVYFLELPLAIQQAVEAGKDDLCEYRIRISNKGQPEVPVSPQQRDTFWSNDGDNQRLFAAAVLVDGVNSLYQDDGTGKIGPVVRHPKECRKWVLCAPGKKLERGANPGSFQLIDATDKLGHSVIDIPGFQMDLDKAAAFTFGRAEESIAETVGITNDVGVIEVHFYPQKMSADTAVLGPEQLRAGTRAGRPVDNPVSNVNFELRRNPCEVWRIYYCYKAPIPHAARMEVAVVSP